MDKKSGRLVRTKDAVNSIGWCVEEYTQEKGWEQCSETFKTQQEARDFFDKNNFKHHRVYEVVK